MQMQITTVSKTYAEEIKMPYYGEGLDGLMRARANDLRGIVNGIDMMCSIRQRTRLFTRTTMPVLSVKRRLRIKLALQADLGLAVDPKVMLIGIVSRLTDQKRL